MPKPVEECVDSVLEDNPEYSESRAYAICHAQQNEGNLSVGDDPTHDDLLQALAENDGECPEGEVYTGGTCVPVEEVGELRPPSIANSSPHIMAARGLNTDPIEREELSDDKVAYRNISMLTEGVWTDQASRTPTLYPEDGIANIQAEYDDSEYNGPPVNVMHDVNPETGETNPASHGGYVDPNSLAFQDGALMGDIILDESTPAGEYADENLQSALQNGGKVGFGGPSVELDLDPDEHIQNSDHPQAEKEISGGYLTGLGLVMDPADKNVAFAKETRQRAVAMSGQSDKAVYLKKDGMSDDDKQLMNVEEVRETLDRFGVDTDESTDEEVAGMAEELMSELQEYLMPEEDGEGEEVEAQEGEDEDEEEDDDDEENPMMEEEAYNALEAEIEELREELATLREQALEEGELEDMKEELAEADTVEEIETRLSELESEPEDSKTLAEGNGSGESEWFDADDTIDYSANSLR